MEDTQLHWLIASSADSSKISLKVTGLIVGLSSTIVLFGTQFLHLTLTANDVTSLATGIGMVAGTVAFVAGLIRHFVIKVGTVKK